MRTQQVDKRGGHGLSLYSKATAAEEDDCLYLCIPNVNELNALSGLLWLRFTVQEYTQ